MDRTEQEVIQMVADHKVMLLTFEVLEECFYEYTRKWLPSEPMKWSDLPWHAQLCIGPLALAWAAMALYYSLFCWLGDVASGILQDAVTDLDPSAQRTTSCLRNVAENALPVST